MLTTTIAAEEATRRGKRMSPGYVRRLCRNGQVAAQQVERRGQVEWEIEPAEWERFLKLDRRPGRRPATGAA